MEFSHTASFNRPLDKPVKLKIFSNAIDLKLEIEFNEWSVEHAGLVFPLGVLHIDTGHTCKILFFYY